MTKPELFLRQIVARQKRGQAAGGYAICSANPYVLDAALHQARQDGSVVLIESTSNQVDQFGGYTGMTPRRFVAFVRRLAADRQFPAARIIFGGDHLGPNAWRREPAAAAMAKARELVAACVRAGYAKIHLDASMRCGDDPAGPLREEVIAERAADLGACAEAAASRAAFRSRPFYVIGTEVPPPGGAQEPLAQLRVTSPADAKRTLAMAQSAFRARGLDAAWERVMALVVQPGVEFSDTTVAAYQRNRARTLSRLITIYPNLVYEAHSTDYQTCAALRQMVQDHFAILKVGPWLTFAFREAVFALDLMEQEGSFGRPAISHAHLRAALERVMVAHPEHWQWHYYHGSPAQRRYARQYSYSDRTRYYWPYPEVQRALRHLLANLARRPAPLTLLSQYLPAQYLAVRAGAIRNHPLDLIRHKIMAVTADYAKACGQTRHGSDQIPNPNIETRN